MNKTIKAIGHKNYFNLISALSIDVQDLLYKQIRLEIQRLDLPVNEEDLGEIVSDVLKTAYEFKY